MMTQYNFQTHLSCLRIVATLSVVWLHTCSTLVQNLDLFPMNEKQICFYNAAYQMMCWAVPVFYMITGALMLNPSKEITVKKCLTKYISRIVMAIFVFGTPFAALKLIMETGELGVSIIPLSLKAVLENDSLRHMWYLYSLLGIYLVLPLFRLFTANAKKNEIELVLISLFAIDFVLPYISNVTSLKIAFELPLKYPVFYLFMGYYLNKSEAITRKHKNIAMIFVVGFTILLWSLNYSYRNTDKLVSYYSPFTALLSISIFVIFKNLGLIDAVYKKHMKHINIIDRLCFGVYLMHPVLIQFTYRFLRITPLKYDIYPFITVAFAIVFAVLSSFGSWILSLIKPLKEHVL